MPGHRSALDWGIFLLLSLFWASAFALTKLALTGLPAGLIVFARLALGASLMAMLMRMQGARLPPFKDRAAWRAILAMGLVGTAAPFYLITQGQKSIDSALAALLIASTPLFTAAIAHLRFADERLTLQSGLGVAVGFAGVALLLGPDAFDGLGDASLIAQLLCLGAGLCYAINTILARGAPPLSPAVLPVGFLASAALASLPMALMADYSTVKAHPATIGAVVALGALPTAAAGYLLILLVQRTSATFVSLTGYAIPVLSAVIGYLAFGETLGWNAGLAFVLILGGVWLTQRRGRAVVKA